MSLNIRSLWVGLVAFATLLSCNFAAAQDIQWAKSLEEAEARAKAEGKIVQLHFWATFCGPCRQLDSFVFPVQEIATKMNQNVVPVKIDTQANPELAKKYAITKIPQDVFLGPNGEVLFRRISPTNSQNYGIMLDTAMKIATQTTRQSQMAVEAIASIGQEKTNVENRSAFLGAEAAKSGNARQQFDADPVHGRNAQLPPATINVSDATAPTQIANSLEVMSRSTQHQMPETRFPNASFEAPKLPTPQNAFANNQIVNRAAPMQPSSTDALPSPMNSSAALVQGQTRLQQGLPQQGLQQSFAQQAAQQTIEQTIERSSRRSDSTAQTLAAQALASPIASVDRQQHSATQVSAEEAEVSRPELGLEGYCPVSLLKEQKWVKGDPNFGRIHRGRLYLFANEQAANQFFADPDGLSPALAGFDPVRFAANGDLVDGERKFGVFCETPSGMTIVLFANSENRDAFKADRQRYLEQIRVATAAADQR